MFTSIMHHRVDFENVEVVRHEAHYHQRLFLEACSYTTHMVLIATSRKLDMKQLKKQGRGSQKKASVSLAVEEVKVLYNKGPLGMSTIEALLLTLFG